MAKSDTPLEQLDLSRAYGPPHSPPWAEDKPIHGFDTETADGDIFMLSIAWEGFGGVAEHNDKEIIKSPQLWDYLTHKQARSSLNMWYNLDFDANVLLKHILTEKELAELTVSGNTKAGKYSITYIPGKFLKIKDKDANVYVHYDASQFFYSSLAEASQEWLDKKKLEDTIDVEKFGKKDGQVNDYIADNWRDIQKYARKDAELVRDLWQEAVTVGENLEIPMGRPFSTGYLGESYLNAHMREKPGLGPRDMQKLAWQSYAGGRFEVIKRGDIGPVAGPDINSAYPWVLAHLPDPKTLTWENPQNPTLEDLQHADYGFVRATITTDKTRPIQPFAIKPEDIDKLMYPALESYEHTTLIDIFCNAYEYGYLQDFEIQEAWLGHDTGGAHYPFDFIDTVYNRRKEFEADGYMKKGLLLKIILNSMYGKMCQTTPKRRKLTDKTTLQEGEDYISDMSLPKMLRQEYSDGFVEKLQAGSWFNPFLASYITGITRLELHKRILEYGLEENTVMLATDSLMIEQGPFEDSGFANDLVESGLGNWDYDYQGEAFVIGAGVYQIDFENGKSKTKTRGFREADISGGLRQAAEKANGKIEISSTRPQTVAEAIWQNRELSDVGKFLEFERDLKPDMDTKRAWIDQATYENLLSQAQHSKPLTISGQGSM